MLKLLAGAAILAASLSVPGAWAQAFPERPIRLVVPYPAGGTTDILARRIGNSMRESLGQPVVVDNKPGAATIIGTEAVKNSTPDGYTLLVIGSTWGSNTLLYKKLPYTLADFAPVSMLIKAPYTLTSNPSVGATLADFITQAKAKPGVLNYGTIGVGGSAHLLAEKLKALTGIDVVGVPYAGAAPALTALTANEVQVYFDAINTSLPHHRGGKLKVLAVTSDERLAAAPDIPTFKELGLPAMTVYFWFGVVAPAGTPKPIVERLNQAIGRAIQEDEFRTRMANDGAIAQPSTPDAFADFITADVAMWGEIIKPLNIQLD